MTALRGSLVAVVLALTAAAPALGAQPYWTSAGKILKEGQRETVSTSGALAFTIPNSGSLRTIKCKVADVEEIENPVGGGAGTDEVTSFSLTGCTGGKIIPCTTSAITATTVGFPWTTELLGPAPTIRDRIIGMQIEFTCSVGGAYIGLYEGELAPKVGTSVLTFGAGSGQLEEPPGTGNTATVNGSDKLKGPPGDVSIGAEEVEHEPHWYSNGKRIPEGTPEPVKTSGTLEFTATLGLSTATLKCKAADTEVVENPLGGLAGIDEMTALAFSGCVLVPKCPAADKLEVVAKPPFPSELIAGTPIRDEISAITVDVKCAGSNPASVVYTGTLTPEVATTSALVFGPGSGSLTGSNTATATVSGTDKLTGPTGDIKVTALDP
jgi:hypothetical protein